MSSEFAGRLLSAMADVALIVDDRGIVQDYAVGSEEMAKQVVGDWLHRPWVDTVTVESRTKVEDLLRDSTSQARSRSVSVRS